jgi:signal transduction histidine kinase
VTAGSSAPLPGPILVVDDNESARYGKVRTLRRAGYEVIEAASGSEALRIASDGELRLVVLDVNLPDVDGWEVCRRIKADAKTASVVVLQVSATHIRQEDTVRALNSGADASLTEPLDPGVLVATVKALLRAREAEEALRDALAREQLARSAAESANQMKDEFLAMLSHELRSPLGAILAWVTLLRTTQTDEKVGRGLEAIERSTRQQVRLIEDLLDVSRISSGKFRLDITEVDLAAVVDEAIESVRPSADAKSIDLDSHVDESIGRLSGDPGRLQQAVWNLLSNAVKFTPEKGHVAIVVEGRDSAVEIRVEDSGAGIDTALLPHVFERFRQGTSGIARSETGLGLGLAIVSHVVALHGGTVHADSPGPGRGATFTIRLPAAVAYPATAAVQQGCSPGSSPELPALDGLRILVLDDEPDAREAVSAVLEGCGAQVTAVAKVSEALGFLARGAIDLVVSDVAMPVEDGYRFIAELRHSPPEKGGELPVLAFTAHAGPEERRRVLDAGFDEFVTKPIEARDLVAAVARLASDRDRR